MNLVIWRKCERSRVTHTQTSTTLAEFQFAAQRASVTHFTNVKKVTLKKILLANAFIFDIIRFKLSPCSALFQFAWNQNQTSPDARHLYGNSHTDISCTVGSCSFVFIFPSKTRRSRKRVLP